MKYRPKTTLVPGVAWPEYVEGGYKPRPTKAVYADAVVAFLKATPGKSAAAIGRALDVKYCLIADHIGCGVRAGRYMRLGRGVYLT